MIGKLYTFRRCPYAIRARLILKLAGLDVDYIQVDLKDKPKDLLEYSSKGTVPVLVLDSGEVIDESLEIIDWVLAYHKPKDWKNLSSEEIDQGERLLRELSDSFIPALNRYKYASRYDDVNLAVESDILRDYLSELESILKETTILSEIPSKYDIAIFPLVRQLNIASSDWLLEPRYTEVNRWFQYWLHHPVFLEVMKKISS